jgi:hypothetical protein
VSEEAGGEGVVFRELAVVACSLKEDLGPEDAAFVWILDEAASP